MLFKKLKILIVIFPVLIGCATLSPKNPIEFDSVATPTFPKNPFADDIQLTPQSEKPEAASNRFTPFPPHKLINVFTLNVEIMSYIRGERAWELIEEENQFNKPPPEGMHYILVEVFAENILQSGMREITQYDFKLTGSGNIRYSSAGIVVPQPAFGGNIDFRESTSGWIPFLIKEDEENLTIIVDLLSYFPSDNEIISYFAIQEGGYLVEAANLENHIPTQIGISLASPAGINEVVSSNSWDLRITEYFRGEEAFEKTMATNQFNEPPPIGLEYVLFWVEVTYFGDGNQFKLISPGLFYSINSQGQKYQTMLVVKPIPELRVELFNRGKYAGWVALIAKINQPALIKFAPFFDFESVEIRYIELK